MIDSEWSIIKVKIGKLDEIGNSIRCQIVERFYAGKCFKSEKQYKDAIEMFEQALKIWEDFEKQKPKYSYKIDGIGKTTYEFYIGCPAIYHELGICYEREKMYQEVIDLEKRFVSNKIKATPRIGNSLTKRALKCKKKLDVAS